MFSFERLQQRGALISEMQNLRSNFRLSSREDANSALFESPTRALFGRPNVPGANPAELRQRVIDARAAEIQRLQSLGERETGSLIDRVSRTGEYALANDQRIGRNATFGDVREATSRAARRSRRLAGRRNEGPESIDTNKIASQISSFFGGRGVLSIDEAVEANLISEDSPLAVASRLGAKKVKNGADRFLRGKLIAEKGYATVFDIAEARFQEQDYNIGVFEGRNTFGGPEAAQVAAPTESSAPEVSSGQQEAAPTTRPSVERRRSGTGRLSSLSRLSNKLNLSTILRGG